MTTKEYASGNIHPNETWGGVQDHKHCFVIWTKPKPDEDIKLGGLYNTEKIWRKLGDLTITERYIPSPVNGGDGEGGWVKMDKASLYTT